MRLYRSQITVYKNFNDRTLVTKSYPNSQSLIKDKRSTRAFSPPHLKVSLFGSIEADVRTGPAIFRKCNKRSLVSGACVLQKLSNGFLMNQPRKITNFSPIKIGYEIGTDSFHKGIRTTRVERQLSTHPRRRCIKRHYKLPKSFRKQYWYPRNTGHLV